MCFERCGVPQYHFWCHISWHQIPLITGHLLWVLLLISIIFLYRPDKDILFARVRAYLHSNNFLFMRKLKEYFLPIHVIGYKQNLCKRTPLSWSTRFNSYVQYIKVHIHPPSSYTEAVNTTGTFTKKSQVSDNGPLWIICICFVHQLVMHSNHVSGQLI